jgi:hypothetical protein
VFDFDRLAHAAFFIHRYEHGKLLVGVTSDAHLQLVLKPTSQSQTCVRGVLHCPSIVATSGSAIQADGQGGIQSAWHFHRRRHSKAIIVAASDGESQDRHNGYSSRPGIHPNQRLSGTNSGLGTESADHGTIGADCDAAEKNHSEGQRVTIAYDPLNPDHSEVAPQAPAKLDC